jgi:ElaB/YqjD/DUF883 family membrane-anchored ribosome-binding protein
MSATSKIDSGSGTQREPEDLQREAEAIRADMDRTLSALERKLSPHQLLDRSLDSLRTNGGEILQKIGATVSKHPLPLLLTSAGLIWLVAASRSSSQTKHRFGSSTESYSDDRLSGSMSAGSLSGSSAEEEYFQSSRQSSVRTHARDLKRRARHTLDATRSRATQTWDATRDRTQELGQNLNSLIREQPLVCGAIALAIGAVLGAAFPVSAYERELAARARQAGGRMLDEMKVERETFSGTAQEAPPLSH